MRTIVGLALISIVVVSTATTAGATTAVASDTTAVDPASPSPVDAAVRAFFDETVPAQLEAHRIPGAAVVVVDGQRQIFAGGYGVADVATGRQVDPDRTVFPIDSVTKLVTATAVMQLVEQDVVDLRTDVNRYLDGPRIDARHPVTLEHLLTHTAGFEEQAIGILPTDPADVGSLVSEIAADQPAQVRPPGSYAGYSNYGMALAGLIVQQRSGQAFDEYVAQHILDPLGMERSGFSHTLPAGLRRDLVERYRVEGVARQIALPEVGERFPPAGGIVSTVTDLGQFMRAHLADGHLADAHLADGRILDAATATDMHRRHFTHDPRLPGMALGIMERVVAGTQALRHSGDGPGSHSVLTLAPDHDLGIYVVVNGDGVDGGGTAAVHAIADEFIARFAPGGPASDTAASDGADGREAAAVAARLAGTYRATRISHSDFTELFAALATDVRVDANGDGTVTTTGLTDPSGRLERRWELIGDRLFREQGGQHLIAFSERALFDGNDPAIAYEQLSWFQLPALHLTVATAGLVLLASSLTWPVAGLVRRRRGSITPSAPGPRVARLLALITIALIIGFMVGLALLASDFERLTTVVVTGAPLLGWLFAPLRLAALSAVMLAICTGLAWRRGWWSRRARLHYTTVAAGAATFMTVAQIYQLVIDPLG